MVRRHTPTARINATLKSSLTIIWNSEQQFWAYVLNSDICLILNMFHTSKFYFNFSDSWRLCLCIKFFCFPNLENFIIFVSDFTHDQVWSCSSHWAAAVWGPDSGLSVSKVARPMKVTKSSISRLVSNVRKVGNKCSLKNLPGQGRKIKATLWDWKRIVKMVKKNSFVTALKINENYLWTVNIKNTFTAETVY